MGAEKAPQGQENQAEQIQNKLKEMVGQIQPLMEQIQSPEGSPEDKLAAMKKLLELLAQIKELFIQMGQEEAYYEQFGELEMGIQQQLGQLEG